MNATYGRFTVTRKTDEDGTFFEMTNEWNETLWNYETKAEAIKEAKRMARDEELDAEAIDEE